MKNMKLYLTVLAASLGGLLSGFDTGVISGALLFINQDWALSASSQGLLVGAVLIGAFLGASLNGFMADIFGRKKIILATAVVFFTGSIFCAVSPNVLILILSRVFVGFAVGVISFAAPLYLSEVSPKDKRGMFVSMYQLSITAGILFSYLIDLILEPNWRSMLLAGVIPSFVLFVVMIFLADTPRWLVSKGKTDEARAVLMAIEPDCDADIEIENIRSTFLITEKFVFKKWMIAPFIAGIGIMFAQICTGVNTIIYYAPTILKFAGFESNTGAIFATAVIGAVNFFMTFVAIAFSDKIGRKPLLYIGLSGVLLSLLMLSGVFAFSAYLGAAVKFTAVLSLVLYIVCFAFSLGPVGMIIISEVFPLNIRGFSMSICIVANFVFNFIVTLSFPVVFEKAGPAATFMIFAVIAFLCLFFVYFFIPETKGISLEKIESNWRNYTKARDF